MKVLKHIDSKGEGYGANIILDDFPLDDNHKNSIFFVGDMDSDWDGSPMWHSDPDGQSDTSLHLNGKPIDASKVPFIVLPPEVIKAVTPMVLGCKCSATWRGVTVFGVVADIGPHYKLGEGSMEMLHRLGANSRWNGGIDEQEVTYRVWPGEPAVVDGIQYSLQHYRS